MGIGIDSVNNLCLDYSFWCISDKKRCEIALRKWKKYIFTRKVNFRVIQRYTLHRRTDFFKLKLIRFMFMKPPVVRRRWKSTHFSALNSEWPCQINKFWGVSIKTADPRGRSSPNYFSSHEWQSGVVPQTQGRSCAGLMLGQRRRRRPNIGPTQVLFVWWLRWHC